MRTADSSSFPHARAPYPLAKALARWSSHAEPLERPIVSAEDNNWAQSHFLVNLLLHATPRRPWLDRDRVREILRAAGSAVTLESLEDRGWVRFIVGQIEIPGGIRGELLRVKHEEALPASEREALHLLVNARGDETPLFWINRDELERIHAAHLRAHCLTPSLQELEKIYAIRATPHEGCEGYVLPWRQREREGLSPWLCTRVLGLYWEALLRNAPRTNYENVDDSYFQMWLVAAFEFRWWGPPTEHMAEPMQERLIKAATRCILNDTDLDGADNEVERFLWETVGFDRPSNLRLPAKLLPNASLLDVHRWFQHSYLHESNGLRTIRRYIDWVISLVIHHENDVQHYNTLEIMRASHQKPYLVYRTWLSLLGHGSAVGALIANLETTSFGMLLLAERRVRLDSDFRWEWEEPAHRIRAHETEKNRLWREAVGVFLATIHEALPENPQPRARALGETLLLAVPGASPRSHRADEDQIFREGSAERLRILLREVATTRRFVLLPLLEDLHAFLAERVKECVRPVAELRILLWMLRTLNADGDKLAGEIDKVANTIVRVYRGVLLRQEFDDYGNIKSWVDDAPGIVDLPWADLVAYLQRHRRTGELLRPDGIDFHDRLSQSYQAKQYEGGDEHRIWTRKTRMHLRLLLATHAHFAKRDFDPVLGLDAKQGDELLSGVENQISMLVTKCARSAHDGAHGSLFAPDAEFNGGGIAGPAGLFIPLMRTLIRFTEPKRRDQLLAGWIEFEKDPTVLLALLDQNVPAAAKERTISRLLALDIEQVAKNARQVTQWQDIARAANIANQPQIVEKILAYGNKHLRPEYREKEWALFEYEMRLMLAYHLRDEGKLDDVPSPPNSQRYRRHVNNHVHDDILDKREFYRGLIKLDKDPAKAREIFGGLIAKYPETISHAINMTAASLRFAKRIDDPDERKHKFAEVLHEWESIERTFPASTLAHYHNNVAGIRLIALDGAGDNDAFDAEWALTDVEVRIDIDMVTLGVTNARRRGLHERANDLLAMARPYYEDAKGNVNERFERLAKDLAVAKPFALASTVRSLIEDLQFDCSAFQRLRDSRASRAVQVIRGSGFRVDEFLMDELWEVAKELAKRKMLIGAGHEPRRNDLFGSLLQMRVAFLKWTVTEGRGGVSTGGREPGERDWVLTNSGAGGEIAIFEALVLKAVDKSYIDEHIDKAVFKYDPSGLAQAYIVVYYEGTTPFQQFWQSYVAHVRSTRLRQLLPARCTPVYTEENVRNMAVARCDYVREGVPHVVYHMALDVSH